MNDQKQTYITVGQLKKQLAKIDDDSTEIFFDIKYPAAIQEMLANRIYLHLEQPKFSDIDIDIDGSKTVWCIFKGWLVSG